MHLVKFVDLLKTIEEMLYVFPTCYHIHNNLNNLITLFIQKLEVTPMLGGSPLSTDKLLDNKSISDRKVSIPVSRHVVEKITTSLQSEQQRNSYLPYQ